MNVDENSVSFISSGMHGNFFEANHERKQWVFMCNQGCYKWIDAMSSDPQRSPQLIKLVCGSNWAKIRSGMQKAKYRFPHAIRTFNRDSNIPSLNSCVKTIFQIRKPTLHTYIYTQLTNWLNETTFHFLLVEKLDIVGIS